MKKVLILGAGFGGLETATGLATQLPAERYQVTLVDKAEGFFIGFAKFDVLFDRRSEEQVTYRYEKLREKGINFVQDEVVGIDIDGRSVALKAGDALDYDYLVVALGAEYHHAGIPGYVESGGYEFYSMAGVHKLRDKLATFTEGDLVLAVFRKPFKCPPATFEAIFELHDYFVERGVRDAINIKMIVPAPKPLPVARGAAEVITKRLEERNITFVTKTPITAIDNNEQVAVGADESRHHYDLFIGVPLHRPPKVVRESKLGPGFIQVDKTNLRTSVDGVYAIGDVSKVPFAPEKAVPKTGAFAEDAGRAVVRDILAREGIATSDAKFEAIGACFFSFGSGEVAKVNANFLGGEKPNVFLEEVADHLEAEKEEFETSRRDRWFNYDG